MTSRARLLAVVLLSAVAFGCAEKEEQPPAANPAASPTAAMAATEAPALPSPPAATIAPTQPAGTAPAGSPAMRPPATAGAATTAPKAPASVSAAPVATPPAAATAAPPPTTQAEKPAVTQPAAPARPAAQRPKGKVTLPAKLGAVTFDHEKHAGTMKIACTTCHHASRPQKPQAAEQQACRDCHTMPAAPPMKTNLQAAFHDPKAGTGTCIDCHKQSVAKGKAAPVKCLECHKKK